MRNKQLLIRLSLASILIASLILASRSPIHKASLNRQLLTAVENSDVATVRRMLHEGADPNATRPLTYAFANLEDQIRVDLGIEGGLARYATSALEIACHHPNNTAIATLLIDSGANINQPTSFNISL